MTDVVGHHVNDDPLSLTESEIVHVPRIINNEVVNYGFSFPRFHVFPPPFPPPKDAKIPKLPPLRPRPSLLQSEGFS